MHRQTHFKTLFVLLLSMSAFACNDGTDPGLAPKPAVCGDAVIEGDEGCDDGNATTESCVYAETECIVCSSECKSIYGDTSYCGDGSVQTTFNEACDSGGEDTANCDEDCSAPLCGDGHRNLLAGEACDDGNITDGDACDSNCTVTACGNGVITTGEDCDDGNVEDGDDCPSTCLQETCGSLNGDCLADIIVVNHVGTDGTACTSDNQCAASGTSFFCDAIIAGNYCVTTYIDAYGYYAIENSTSGAISYADTSGIGFDTVGAAQVATGDLNADGKLDVVFANHTTGPAYATESYIYYGDGLGGFTSETIPTQGAIGVAIADLDDNGYPELIFGNHTYLGIQQETNSFIYWGESSGFHTGRKTLLPTSGADTVSIADLNQDDKLDIVISNNQNNQGNREINSYIYWGTSSVDSEGYPAYGTTSRTELATQGATYNTVDDIDGDGWLDILFSNFRDGDNTSADYEIDSIIYWGSQSGFSGSDTTSLATKGANGCNIADLDKDGHKDIVFSQARSNGSNNVNAIIYWGYADTSPSATHGTAFSNSQSVELPTSGSTDNAIEDLNGDTWPDIVMTNLIDDSTYIYWNTEGTFSTGNRTALPSLSPWGLAIAKKD